MGLSEGELIKHILVEADALCGGGFLQGFVEGAGDAEHQASAVFLQAVLEISQGDDGPVVHGLGMGKAPGFGGGKGFRGLGIDGVEPALDLVGG